MSPDPPFLDPGPISDPALVDEDDGPTDTMPSALPDVGTAEKALCPECLDASRNAARIGMVIGTVIGVGAGVAVAYVILRGRLAPIG